MLHIVRVLAALTLTLLSWGLSRELPAGPVVRAEPPAAVSAPVTDRVGVLDGRRAEVEAAVAKLRAHHGVRLYVVYVRGFSGLSATDWAARTARLSGLGRLDLLLAVSTVDGRYAVSADAAFPLSGAQLDSVAATTIEPELRHADWVGLPIVAAREYDAALTSPGVVFALIGPAGRVLPVPAAPGVRPGHMVQTNTTRPNWTRCGFATLLRVRLDFGSALLVSRRCQSPQTPAAAA
ncbi:TPM domain-containing protein [Streptosporangium sp. CA-135522]|uniref:TPM domain-containing protein n=1 Tax=Streptosporangium sp. CA-135522 TaxID=3240072 RepID=UPI003D9250E7